MAQFTIQFVFKRSLLSLLLTALFPILASAQTTCRRLLTEPSRMVLTRYGTQPDFSSGISQAWVERGDSYAAAASARERYGNFSILDDQQAFSIEMRVKSGALSPERAQMLRTLGGKLEPGQVDMFEMVRGDDYVNEKKAALWSIAGQVWDARTGVREVPIAWEREPKRDERALDRTKYKYLWEWGRAAQDEPGTIAPLYSAAATLNYLQLRAMGGKLEDAYVVAHSGNKANTRLYSKMHPDTLFPADWKNMENALFVIPLKAALEKHPPRKASAHVARIIELSGGKLSDLQALDLLFDSRELRWSEMDFVDNGAMQSTPVILSDVSMLRPVLVSQKIRELGLSPAQQEAVFHELGSVNPLLNTGNFRGKYRNASDSLLGAHTYHERNAIEVSSLDPELARRDPDYVLKVLMSSMGVMQERIAQSLQRVNGLNETQAMAKAITEMERMNIQFGITTGFKEVQSRVNELKPNAVVELPGTVNQDGTPVAANDPMVLASPYLFRDSKMNFFTMADLRRLYQARRDLFVGQSKVLRTGIWRAHYFMSQSDLF